MSPKEKLQHARERLDECRQRLARAEERERRLAQRVAKLARQVMPSSILPSFRRAPRHDREAATARQHAFATARRQIGECALRDTDVRVDADGMAFWVPQKFAHKAITIPWTQMQRVRAVAVGGIMLDIGANIGQTSIPRALLGDFTAIYAAEPDPSNYARLVEAVRANDVRGVVLPDRVAISDETGTLRFAVGHYRGVGVAVPSTTAAIDVPALTLDEWIRCLGLDPWHVSFVKVDVNGYEREVLRGAADLLSRRTSVWQLEIPPAAMHAHGTSLVDLCTLIEAHFSHFIDLDPTAPGPLVRPTSEMADALAYLDTRPTSSGGKTPQTDVLCFTCG